MTERTHTHSRLVTVKGKNYTSILVYQYTSIPERTESNSGHEHIESNSGHEHIESNFGHEHIASNSGHEHT